MNTLSKDIEITVSGFNIIDSGAYRYEVLVNNPNGTFNTIFTGTCWLEEGTTSKTFYLNDILNTCRGGFEDILNIKNDTVVKDITIYCNVKVYLYTAAATFYQSSKQVYFAYTYPNDKWGITPNFKYRTAMGNNEYVYNLILTGLTPRLPYLTSLYYMFPMAFQFNTNKNDTYKLYFEGGVLGEAKNIQLGAFHQPRLYNFTLTDLYENTYCNGTDGTIYLGIPATTLDITSSCTFTLNNPVPGNPCWGYDSEYDEYLICLPTGIEVWDEAETTFIYDIPNLYDTTERTYESEFVEVDFDRCDGISICGTATGTHGYIEITDTTHFTGKKMVKISFTYYYDPDSMRLTGYLSNIKVEIGEPVKKLFDVAKIDACPAKYYLVWQDRLGGFQSQPFNGTPTYSESLSYESIKSYKNVQRHSVVTVTPKWKINSKWVTERELQFYESIYTSPQLLLYDTEGENAYNVVIDDDSYTEKTYYNQGRKLFNVQLNVSLDRQQNIIY